MVEAKSQGGYSRDVLLRLFQKVCPADFPLTHHLRPHLSPNPRSSRPNLPSHLYLPFFLCHRPSPQATAPQSLMLPCAPSLAVLRSKGLGCVCGARAGCCLAPKPHPLHLFQLLRQLCVSAGLNSHVCRALLCCPLHSRGAREPFFPISDPPFLGT